MDAAPTEPPAPVADCCPQCGHEVGGAWLVCAWCGQPLAAAAELPAGARIGADRYQVLRVIGRGGFGITYDAGDRRLQRRVAIKELFPESAVRHGSMVLTPPQGRASFKAARDRFLREARVLARFTHPGIVRVYEVFEEHGTAYLVMELLEGRTLVDLLRERNRPFAEADLRDLAGRVAAALRPVHAAGVLHRDINPSNVMMTHHGRIVLIDFGLARDYDQTQTAGMTRVVTPGYAPLEQYRGEGHFGPSTDVYGLAATLYRLGTGKVPVSAMERDAGASLPSPRSLNPDLSRAFSDAVLDGLELEPSHRPQDLDAFLARLGIRGLPDGPRSTLLDTVPPPHPAPPLTSGDVARPLGAGPAGPWSPPPAAVPAPVPAAAAAATPVPATDLPPASAPDGDDHTVVEPARPVAFLAVEDHDRTVLEPGRGGAATRVAPVGPAPLTAGDGTRYAADETYAVPPGPAPTAARVAAPPLPAAARPSRRRVSLPLAAMALAASLAAPVLAIALVVLVALPWLATFGDSEAQRLRALHGIASGWAERRLAPGALAPTRFVRNLVVSVVRASPIVGVGAALLAGWYGLRGLDLPDPLLDLGLRVIGAAAVGSTLAISRDGSSRFRVGLGLDALAERLAPEGRTTERVVVLWLVAGLLVAGSLWLSPDPFPLP